MDARGRSGIAGLNYEVIGEQLVKVRFGEQVRRRTGEGPARHARDIAEPPGDPARLGMTDEALQIYNIAAGVRRAGWTSKAVTVVDVIVGRCLTALIVKRVVGQRPWNRRRRRLVSCA